MADISVVHEFFGKNLFVEYDMNPWWEDAHSSFAILNGIFLLLFGISYAIISPDCLPKNATSTSVWTDKEAEFVSNFCRIHAFTFFDPDYAPFIILFIVLLPIPISNLLLPKEEIGSAICTFSENEDNFKKLDLPLERLKQLAIMPSILNMKNEEVPSTSNKRDGENSNIVSAGAPRVVAFTDDQAEGNVEKLRKICLSLWQYESSTCITRSILFREIALIVILVIIVGVLVFAVGYGIKHTYERTFNCTIDRTWFDIVLTIDDTVFTCTQTWTRYDCMMIGLFGIITFLHLIVRITGWRKICRLAKGEKNETNGQCHEISSSAKKTRQTMLFLSGLCLEARLSKNTDFAKFVGFIFSNDTINSMVRFYRQAKAQNNDLKADLRYMKIVRRIIGSTDKTERQTLIEDKQWKTLVELINEFGPSKDLKELLRGPNLNAEDSQGNSVLFYALNRELGSRVFKTRAAQYFLKLIKVGPVGLTASGQAIPARKFVDDQYLEDPSYPLSLKRELLELISNHESRSDVITNSFTANERQTVNSDDAILLRHPGQSGEDYVAMKGDEHEGSSA